ncbi:MAG: hypothetical protein KDD66_16775 [Bdellovibrionales bacterium]|nr:hypothetical protein [Bdellovibrionales bacterium]
MPLAKNQRLFEKLRTRFPVFQVEPWNLRRSSNGFNVCFNYSISEETSFSSSFDFSFPQGAKLPEYDDLTPYLAALCAIDALSYWKCCCSPTLNFSAAPLADPGWWQQLFYNGTSEFRFVNGITVSAEEFVTIAAAAPAKPNDRAQLSGHLIPVGGGKDSVVTLELLKEEKADSTVFIFNPRDASLLTAEHAGFPSSSHVHVKHPIDPKLLELNELGYLNGHTPFSALLAFAAAISARCTGRKNIILSNESSANEGNLSGSDVNHQWSKTFEFEQLAAEYLRLHCHPQLNYFSLLRPLNELQIAQRFADCPHQFTAFRSCNAGSKNNSWCGKCPKCLFVYISLAPFLSSEELSSIFGRNLLEDPELEPILFQLTGQGGIKPLECVGTHEEVCAALKEIADQYYDEPPLLVRKFMESDYPKSASIETLLGAMNEDHLVPQPLIALLDDSRNKNESSSLL